MPVQGWLKFFCQLINGVDKLGWPVWKVKSRLSLLGHWIVVEQRLLKHTFNCASLLITLTICQVCLAPRRNFARHSISIFHEYFCLSCWSSHANKVRITSSFILFIMYTNEVFKPRICSRRWQPLIVSNVFLLTGYLKVVFMANVFLSFLWQLNCAHRIPGW